MGSTYPSPSPQRAAVARRLFLIVDRGGQAGNHTDARTAESPTGQQPNPCPAKQSEEIMITERHTPLSPRARAKGGGEETPRRSWEDPLARRLLTGGSANGCSAPAGEVRGDAGRPPRRSSPAAGAAAAPPRAQPRLLSGSPRPRRTLSGTGGRGKGEGEEEERTGRRREWRESWAQ